MGRRAIIVEHAGRRILCIDFTGLRTQDEALAAIADVKATLADEPPDALYSITDVSDATADRTAMRALMDLARHNRQWVRSGAVVGVSPEGTRGHDDVERVSEREFPVFASHDEALDWVLRQD